MDHGWQILRRGGLPLGAPCGGAPPSASELADAALAVLAAGVPLSARERAAPSAFLLAWRRQWPRAFARAFGTASNDVTHWAEGAASDPDRYLKLSRIAMAHLASVL